MDNSLSQYLELFLENRSLIESGSPRAMNRLREEALENLERARLPRTGDEGYVYTSPEKMFAPDYGVNLGHIDFRADVAASFRCEVPNLSTLLGVVVNDSFHPAGSLRARLPEGVTFCSFREAAEKCPEVLELNLGLLAPLTEPAVALNTLLATDGVLVRIAAGVHLDKPLQLVNIFNANMPLMGVRRVLVVAEEDSRASILVCDHTQTPDTRFLSSEVVEIIAGPRATLDYYCMESSSESTSRLSNLYVRQAEGSRFTLGGFTLSCGTTRNNFHIDVQGERCETFVGGMAIASGNQVIDNNSRVNHLAPRCHSLQLFKNVLDGDSRGAFEGRILVTPEAPFTEAYQSNRNMLASESARVHTEPQLEIYCDDVKCSHGATTGQLDADALFYMRTRGIPLREARIMLMQAFMADVIDSVRMESLRDRLHHLVERRFAGAPSACGECAAQCSKQ